MFRPTQPKPRKPAHIRVSSPDLPHLLLQVVNMQTCRKIIVKCQNLLSTGMLQTSSTQWGRQGANKERVAPF